MTVIRTILGIAVGVIFAFLLIFALASERASNYYNRTDAVSSTLDNSGFFSFYYNSLLPALISDVTTTPFQLNIAGIPVSIDMRPPDKQAALVRVVSDSFPQEEAITFLKEGEDAIKAVAQGSETLPSSQALVNVFGNLPREFEEDAENLAVGSDISKVIANSVAETESFASFQIFGLSISTDSVRTIFQEEIFPEEWVDSVVLGVLNSYADYVSNETDTFSHQQEVSSRLLILKRFFADEIDKADERNELKVGTLLAPVLERISRENRVAGLPALDPEEIDGALEEGGLRDWRKGIVIEITDTFVEYIAGDDSPVIEIDLTENRATIVEVLSSKFQEELASTISEIPDCASDSTEEATALEAFRLGTLPSCAPSASAFISDTLGTQLFPGAGQLGGLLATIVPNIDIRNVIIEISRNVTMQAVEDLLPDSFSLPWEEVLRFIPEEDAAELQIQRESLSEGISFSESNLMELQLLGFSKWLREGITLPEGIASAYVDIIGNFAIANWVFPLVVAAVCLLIAALIGGKNTRQRLMWLGAVLFFSSAIPLTILILGQYLPPAVLNLLFALVPELTENLPEVTGTLTTTEGLRIVGSLFNEIFLPTTFYSGLAAGIGFFIFIIALLAGRNSGGKLEPTKETEILQ